MAAKMSKATVQRLAVDGAVIDITDMRDTDIPGKALVSRIVVNCNPRHWKIDFWNRGAHAGTLAIDAEDGIELLDRIIPAQYWLIDGY